MYLSMVARCGIDTVPGRDLLAVFNSGTDWLDEIKIEDCHGNTGKTESSSFGSKNTFTLNITQTQVFNMKKKMLFT